MSRKRRREITCFLYMVIFYFQRCHSVSLGKREDGLSASQVQEATRWERIRVTDAQEEKRHLVEHGIQGPNLHKSSQPALREHEAAAFPEEPLPYALDESDINSMSWPVGGISKQPRSSVPQNGYPGDFTGFDGVQGKILSPSLYSTPHLSEWLTRVKPSVQCGDNVMTFTASGEGFTNLLVNREGASPISLFQLPPYCGYSVRTSWSDLEMMVPYEACYVTQENGSYVLALLWWDAPLKLSCPVQMSTPAHPSFHSAPSVFCSPYGMAVQMHGQEEDIVMLGVIVNGGWRPFVSEECAYHVNSNLEELTFFISYSALCITSGDNLQLHFTLDDQEYILSCPVNPQFPPQAPGDPKFPYIPNFVTPAPTSTPPVLPQPPTQEEIANLPDYSHYPYPGFQYPQLPQVYPPGPQPARPPRPTPGSPPGPQQQSLQLTGPGKLPYSPEVHPKYPLPPYHPSLVLKAPSLPDLGTVQERSPHHVSKLPIGPSQYPSGVNYPYVPFFYPAVAPVPTPAATQPPKPPGSTYYPPYYFQMPYDHAPAALPPSPLSPPSPPKQPLDPQYPFSPFYPPTSYIYNYYAHLFHPNRGLEVQPHLTIAPPSLTTTWPTPHILHQCPMGRMVVLLPFAHPDSIQVRDQMKTWLFLSSVSPLCGYVLQMADNSVVILQSPLPACHSHSSTLTTVSLPLRFWDLSMAQYRTMDPQCPYPNAPESPALTPSVSPTPPCTTKGKISPSVVPKPEVFCSSNHMTLELPSGPISKIVVKDIRGNQMNLHDPPKNCGYSVRKDKDGKIRLRLQLHLHCHMIVQGNVYIITVVYMTVTGRHETQFFCPVVISESGQECNLPSEQRLPCGPGSVSQPQCRSMGCCFSKQPPACYYPMDECSIDRHFVFFVPASLTEPPLSPALLVTAGNATCTPQRVTSDYALFKIPMDGCGTHRVMVGKTMIYMVEVVNKVQSISLSYGTITRDSPVRLLVECRFLPNTVRSVSYMVKTPTLGPAVQTQGIFGVQLRIAKDAQYSSYHPQYHQPLQMLLGKPLYLEVRLLNTPDPSLVLLVHFCVAYPRSGTAVWLLLYNGCPNPLDAAPQQALLFDPEPSSPPAQTRRFTISTFQFLPDGEFKDPDEEIYFMCSTEICSPRDGPCVEGCFGQ